MNFKHENPEQEPQNAEDATFERALAKSMRRVNAPESLAKFLAVAAAAEHDRTSPQGEWKHPRVFAFPCPRPFPSRTWLGGAIAAVLVLGCFGAEDIHVKRERAVANQQFDVALHATDHALDQTREQLRRAGVPALQ